MPNGGSASYLGERETGKMQRYGGAGLRLQMVGGYLRPR